MALLYWDKKQSRLTSLEDFSINSIIQSHTVSFVLFVTQRSFPGHPSSKLLLQAADAIRGALVKEERLVKEEQTHGHDAVPVAEAVEVEPSEHQKLYPDEQPDYPFAVEVDSADTTPAHSPSYKNTNGDVSLSQMMEESPQSKSRALDAPTAEKGPEEEIPKIPKQHDSLESLQQVDEVQAAARYFAVWILCITNFWDATSTAMDPSCYCSAYSMCVSSIKDTCSNMEHFKKGGTFTKEGHFYQKN